MMRLLLFAFSVFCLVWGARERIDGFSPSIIEGSLVLTEGVEPSSQVKEILSQPFRYLNKGRQSFVFESKDGQYVLKFFNQKYIQMPWYSFLFREREQVKRNIRKSFYESSYSIAFKEFNEEILYLHMGATTSLGPLSIFDKGSNLHILNLNQIPFVLQKKGIPLYTWLESVYKEKGEEGLHCEIDSYLKQIGDRITKNIADADHDVEHNWGYVDGHIFHLDPGRLYYHDLSDPARRLAEWSHATRNFSKWLEKHYPQSALYLDQQIDKFYNEIDAK